MLSVHISSMQHLMVGSQHFVHCQLWLQTPKRRWIAWIGNQADLRLGLAGSVFTSKDGSAQWIGRYMDVGGDPTGLTPTNLVCYHLSPVAADVLYDSLDIV